MKDDLVETLRRTAVALEPHRQALAAAWAAALGDLDPEFEGDADEECARTLERVLSHLSRGDLGGLLNGEAETAHGAARTGADFRSEAISIRTLDRCCLPFLLDAVPERAALAETLVALGELSGRRLELLLQAQEDESARRLIETEEQAAAEAEHAHELETANEALRRAEARAANRAEQVALLAAVARRVVGVLDPERLLQEAADAIQGQRRNRFTAVVTLDAQGRLVGRWAGRGGVDRQGGGRADGPPGGVIGRAIRRRAPQVVPDVACDSDYHADVPGTVSELVVPLIEEGKVVGAIDFQSDRPSAFDLDDVVAAEAIAEFVTIALRNARLYQASQQPNGASGRGGGG